MTGILESVAKAIFRAGFHADETEDVVAQKWEEWPESRWACRRKAHAAIEAVAPFASQLLRRVEPQGFVSDRDDA